MRRFKATVRECSWAASPNSKWELDVRRPDGKRERLFFPTKEKAEAEARRKEVEYQSHGTRGLDLDDGLRADALDAKQKLGALGVSLREVVNDYVRRRSCASMTVSECSERYQVEQRAKKNKRSDKHLTALRCVFARFGAAFPTQRMCDLTADDVKHWLRRVGGGAGTFNSYRTLLHALFELAVEEGGCVENPVKRVRREEVQGGEVGILSPEQLKRLLSFSSGDIRASIAIGAFAGIRPEEIVRLTWEEVNWGRGVIEVNAAKSKTGSHRYVKILPCLDAWIRPLIASGSIQGGNFRRRYEEARRNAGFAVRGNCERRGEDEGLVPWPHDALRHSFASYHLAKYQQLDALALELGHVSTKLVFRHYRRRVSVEEAEAYFEVLP